MGLLLRAVALLLLVPATATVLLFAACLQDRPLVSDARPPTADDIARLKQVLQAQHPAGAGGNGVQTISLDEDDLTVAANYLARQLGNGAARVSVRRGTATVQTSLELPSNPIGRYVNVDAGFRDGGSLPKVDRLKVGRLPLPAVVAEALLGAALDRLAGPDGERLASRVIQSASFGDGMLTVTYRHSGEAAALARTMLVAPEDQARLRAYQERLADAVAGAPPSLSLAALMPPLFQLAADRGANGEPARENRAVIVVLALYATGKSLDPIVAAAAGWRRPAVRTLTLAGRDDLPKHFLVSAAIAAAAGSPLADAIGLHKEIEDSLGGSGFSFTDIGANRAGTRFGEVASHSPHRAPQLAQALAAGVAESDFMPAVSDLPEFMPEAQFKRRFGGIGSPAYEKMIATIEERIDALALLRR